MLTFRATGPTNDRNGKAGGEERYRAAAGKEMSCRFAGLRLVKWTRADKRGQELN